MAAPPAEVSLGARPEGAALTRPNQP